jgi:hypothetical protein
MVQALNNFRKVLKTAGMVSIHLVDVKGTDRGPLGEVRVNLPTVNHSADNE